jgi:hypothetical protein
MHADCITVTCQFLGCERSPSGNHHCTASLTPRGAGGWGLQVFRQADPEYTCLLNTIRSGATDERSAALEAIESRYVRLMWGGGRDIIKGW